MERLGNIFTHYSYSTTEINLAEENDILTISSQQSQFHVKLRLSGENIALPHHSPFSEWKEARRFAGPLPFTFNCNEHLDKVVIIEGVRENWTPSPIEVIDYDFEFLNTLPIDQPVLANAFIIKDIPYFWKKGKLEQWP